MAGFIAENILEGHVKIVHWYDIENIDPDTMVVDIRTEEQSGHIKHAVNIPLDELRERLDEIPRDRKYTCIAPWDYVVIPPPNINAARLPLCLQCIRRLHYVQACYDGKVRYRRVRSISSH